MNFVPLLHADRNVAVLHILAFWSCPVSFTACAPVGRNSGCTVAVLMESKGHRRKEEQQGDHLMTTAMMPMMIMNTTL